MCTRLIASLVFAASTPLVAAAQVAATAPAPAAPRAVAAPAVTAVVAASPSEASGPYASVAPVVAPVAALDGQSTPELAQAPQAAAPPQPPTPSTGSQNRAERAAARAQAQAAAEQMQIEDIRERRAARSKGVNVRIDATVIESHGDQVTGRKVLSLTLVDGGDRGSVRSTQSVPFKPKGTSGYTYRGAPLNMDARAFLRDDGRIKVELTLEYQGGVPAQAAETADGDASPLDQGITQSVAALFESGKPLIVAQSADAVGDRRVALEVKATVLK